MDEMMPMHTACVFPALKPPNAGNTFSARQEDLSDPANSSSRCARPDHLRTALRNHRPRRPHPSYGWCGGPLRRVGGHAAKCARPGTHQTSSSERISRGTRAGITKRPPGRPQAGSAEWVGTTKARTCTIYRLTRIPLLGVGWDRRGSYHRHHKKRYTLQLGCHRPVLPKSH
jgi:hypothetical protein